MIAPTDNWWYSPQCMLLFADLALEHCASHGIAPPGELEKAVVEGRAGAIFALGLESFLDTKLWMRLVHPREGAPDIRIMYFDNAGPRGSHRMNILQVEVTTYTRHATDSLGDFLYRTKLDPKKKAYAANTVIVAFIQRACTPAEISTAHEELTQRGARGLCYLIGRVDSVQFQVVQVYPQFRGPQDINLNNAFESQRTPVVEVKRGMSSVATVSDDPIPTANPFLELM